MLSKRARHLLLPALVLLLVAWFLGRPDTEARHPQGQAEDSAAQPTPAASEAPTGNWWVLAREATARADEADPLRASLDAREAQWCDRAPSNPDDLDAFGADTRSQRWALHLQALRQSTDPRRRAVADWLELSFGGVQATQASLRERLRRQALDSQDALIVVLALQRGCQDSACLRELKQHWRRLEPQNLRAQLSDHQHRDIAEWLQASAASTYSDSHRSAVIAMLQELPSISSRGPLQLIDSIEHIGLIAAWSIPAYSDLTRVCKTPDSQHALVCAQLAERLWSLGDEDIEPAIALAMIAQQPALHDAWRERAKEWQLTQQLMREEIDAQGQPKRWFSQVRRCRGAPVWVQDRVRVMGGREVAHWRKALQQPGVDRERLLAAVNALGLRDPLAPSPR